MEFVSLVHLSPDQVIMIRNVSNQIVVDYKFVYQKEDVRIVPNSTVQVKTK